MINLHNISKEVNIPAINERWLRGMALFQLQYPQHPLFVQIQNGEILEIAYRFQGNPYDQRIWTFTQIDTWVRSHESSWPDAQLDWRLVTIVNIP